MTDFMRNNETYDEATNELFRYMVANHGEVMLEAAGYLDWIAERSPEIEGNFEGLALHIRQLLVAGALDEALHPYRKRIL